MALVGGRTCWVKSLVVVSPQLRADPRNRRALAFELENLSTEVKDRSKRKAIPKHPEDVNAGKKRREIAAACLSRRTVAPSPRPRRRRPRRRTRPRSRSPTPGPSAAPSWTRSPWARATSATARRRGGASRGRPRPGGATPAANVTRKLARLPMDPIRGAPEDQARATRLCCEFDALDGDVT